MKRFFLLLLSASLVLCGGVAWPHDLDLAGSRWCVARDGVVATIDLDSNLLWRVKGVVENYDLDDISPQQMRQMSKEVIQPYVASHVFLTADGKSLPLKVHGLQKKGGMWEIDLSANGIPSGRPARKVQIRYLMLFEETDNQHQNLGYLYRTDEKSGAGERIFGSPPVGKFTFSHNSPTWKVDLKEAAGRGAADQKAPAPPASAGAPAMAAQFVLMGIRHILAGYDHIAFLLALLVIGLSLREVFKVITAFTAAHSITLLLAALDIVRLDSRLVESAIALSICYVALENIFRKKADYRAAISFAFGLIHGFGFASALEGLVLGRRELILSVVSFNVGVEAGQLAIFAVMLPLLYFLKKRFQPRLVTAATSAIIFAFGFAWLIERVFHLNLLSI